MKQSGPVGNAYQVAVDAADQLFPSTSVILRSRFGGSREAELSVLPKFVGCGDLVVDVGAHKGLYSWHLQRLVGPSGSVHAFEPQPDLSDYLKRAFRGSRTVLVHELALSASRGIATLTVPLFDGAPALGHATLEESGGRSIEVQTVPFDSLGLAPRFMKIDVEGHELGVLSGAMETLETSKPFLLLEIDRRSGRDPSKLIELLQHLDYHGYVLNDDGILAPMDVRRLLDPSDPILATRYAYNFFFLPRTSGEIDRRVEAADVPPRPR
ncbi:MAG: FkbM family methyltransferase [Actinomycetota bacterium]|nr:FkbM family methyltransferase [Actinomycetota bacterium]